MALLFGVALSDHQSEAYDDRFPPDIWDVWEQRAGVTPRGRAIDFWNRWEEDALNTQRLGCRAFRFSIAWARVEPRPGEFDQSVLDHYCAIVARLRELGLEPIVTLCHFVWPQHVEDRGGLRSERFPEWFAAYAARVRLALDPHVRYWLTFHEPNVLLQGFCKPWFQPDFSFPPGYSLGTPLPEQIDATLAVMRHLFEAHAAARRALREGSDGERNLVSANVFQLGLPSIVQRLIDRNVAKLKTIDDWRVHLWRVVERPALFGRQVDLIIAPASQLSAPGFEAAYFVTGLGALLRRESDVRALADLAGRRVGLVRGPAWEHIAAVEAQLDGSRIDFFDRHEQALALLDAGRLAAVVADHTTLSALTRLHAEYRMLDERFSHQAYAIAAEAGHPALIDAAQQAIRALQSEAGWIDLHRRYFPAYAETQSPPFQSLPHAPDGTVLRHIQDRGRLIVGLLLDGSDSDRVGIERDLGRALAGVIFGDSTRVEFRYASISGRAHAGLDDWLRAYTTFSTFISSSWWQLGMRGRLPDFLCPRECINQLDFAALDYYAGVHAPTPGRLKRLAQSAPRPLNRAPVWADGLRQALRYTHAMFPDLPIVIAENSLADEPAGHRRGEYIVAHVRAAQHAIAEGIDVRAYCVWSIASSREWGAPQDAASDFGLYYVDLDSDPELRRRETPGAAVYRKLIERDEARVVGGSGDPPTPPPALLRDCGISGSR